MTPCLKLGPSPPGSFGADEIEALGYCADKCSGPWIEYPALSLFRSAVAIPSVSSHCRRCCTAILPQSRVRRGRRRAKSSARKTSICSAGGRMVPDTAEIRTSACMSAVAIPAVSIHCRRCCMCRSATESCEARSSARKTAIWSAGGRVVPDITEIRTPPCMSAVAIPAVSSHCRRCCTCRSATESCEARSAARETPIWSAGGRDGTGHRRDSHVCLHVCRRDSLGLEPL